MEPGKGVVVAERFRLNALIGQGGMGSVWHATHLGLDTPCAVKFIEGDFAEHPEARARFAREAKAAALLRSAHVVQILDHGMFDGTPYIAMELLVGEDLAARMAREGRLAPADVLWIVEHICRALSKAHASGIVHRDLKPENVFIVRDDERELAKVLDFGVAKLSSGLDGSKTKTGSLLGTPRYMSPEQACGTATVDHRSDLWALGIVAYQALTGELPFDSDALGDLLLQIMTKPLPVPSLVADVPPGFDAWWEKAAAREPEARFQSARELCEALAAAISPSGSVPAAFDRGSSPHLVVAPAREDTPAGPAPAAARPGKTAISPGATGPGRTVAAGPAPEAAQASAPRSVEAGLTASPFTTDPRVERGSRARRGLVAAGVVVLVAAAAGAVAGLSGGGAGDDGAAASGDSQVLASEPGPPASALSVAAPPSASAPEEAPLTPPIEAAPTLATTKAKPPASAHPSATHARPAHKPPHHEVARDRAPERDHDPATRDDILLNRK